MVDQQPISSPEVNEGIFFSEVNAANHFLPELQDVNISFERQISREIKQLSTQAGGSREARRQLVNEALHQVRRAGREYGFQKGRHWLPPENEPFNALVKFNSQISRLFESTPDVAQLYDDLKALYSSYVELGTAQRRYGDKLASILYTSLRGIDVNFGEILSTLNRLEPEERAEIITHCYQERHGRTFVSDLE
ncbi:MAG: hypothetical protein KDD62_05900 [Bdellovibrionales bacterium]|nr:hypothetical protein [Bdellovibrionales bacterium]